MNFFVFGLQFIVLGYGIFTQSLLSIAELEGPKEEEKSLKSKHLTRTHKKTSHTTWTLSIQIRAICFYKSLNKIKVHVIVWFVFLWVRVKWFDLRDFSTSFTQNWDISPTEGVFSCSGDVFPCNTNIATLGTGYIYSYLHLYLDLLVPFSFVRGHF